MTDEQLTNSHPQTGPLTPAGKRRASFNAFKHGLSGKVHVHTPEESEAFRLHCQAYHAELSPAGIIETDLVQSIAEDQWRLKRARAIENNIFAAGINHHTGEIESGDAQIDDAFAEGKTWVEQSRCLALVTLYEQRIHRSIEKATARLEALQAKRKEAYAEAENQAVLLTNYAEQQGETYDPAGDFQPASRYGHFVYSKAAIFRVRDRRARVFEALTGNDPLPRRPAALPNAA